MQCHAVPFQPSRALCTERHIQPIEVVNALHQLGIKSENYQGIVNLDNILLLKHLNCALHLTGIPVEATTAQVFREIRDGGIYNYSPTGPEPGKHETSAAHLAFKTPRAAQEFHFRANHTAWEYRL
jgi:hypothetical protein